MNESPGEEGGTTARAVSRRRLLKGATAAAVAAALGAGLGRIKSGSGSNPAVPPAQTSRKRAHQWAMVIDLRKCDGCGTIDAPPP